MWLLWSGVSRLTPSQQSGNATCRARPCTFASGHVGTVLCGRTPPSGPQFHVVIDIACGVVDFELPAIILKPVGNACSGASVCRR